MMANVTCGLCGGDIKGCNTAWLFGMAMKRAAMENGFEIQVGDIFWRVGVVAWEAAAAHAMGEPPSGFGILGDGATESP
jgi:hypothetical protein